MFDKLDDFIPEYEMDDGRQDFDWDDFDLDEDSFCDTKICRIEF